MIRGGSSHSLRSFMQAASNRFALFNTPFTCCNPSCNVRTSLDQDALVCVSSGKLRHEQPKHNMKKQNTVWGLSYSILWEKWSLGKRRESKKGGYTDPK